MYEWVFTYDSATVNFISDFSTATSSTCALPVNDLTANFNIVITNVPTDTSKTYSVSFVFTEGLEQVIQAEIIYAELLQHLERSFFNGGTPTLSSTSATVIIQSFSIPSYYVTENSSIVLKRHILSSVNSHF